MPMRADGIIDIKPLPKQRRAWNVLLDKVTKYLLFGGGAGGGKSWLGCEWLLYMCYVYPGTKWFIGRKELKRLMQSTFETWKKVCSFHGIPNEDWNFNGQYNYIQFKNGPDPKNPWLGGSKIDLLDVDFQPRDPIFERFGSMEYTGGWLEEAGEIHFLAFDVLKTRIGRHLNKEFGIHPKLLLTANPKKNWLRRIIWKPFVEGTLKPIYAFIQSLYKDNHHTSELYGEQLAEITDKATRQRLEKGDWNYDDEPGTLVDNEAIQDLWSNVLEYEEEKFATLDVARFGNDTSRLYLWRGWNVYRIRVWEKTDLETLKEEVKVILRDEKIARSRLIIDEVGVGGGVLDGIKGARGFIANASPWENPTAKPQTVMRNGELVEKHERENFRSLKDQCGYHLADKINRHLVALDCEDEKLREEIEEEVAQLKDATPDEDGKKRLVPKDVVKENIGRSPDNLDCLIMRVAFELNPPKEEAYADETEIRRNRQVYGSRGYQP